MNDFLKYKDYCGSINVDMEDGLLHGKLLFIRDVVTYEGGDPKELEKAFKNAVDDYIHTCKELNREPQKPFSGTFNVRVGQELHKKAAQRAVIDDRFYSLNDLVKYALDQLIAENSEHTIHHVHHIGAPQRKEFIVPNLIGDEEKNQWQIKSIPWNTQH